ncbi:MAG: flagellar biosynthetic protein FliR [Cellvibrionaceae bacterium]|nr:flagellar biosynthetic protein FliR [Cellvibrionaceae bacterium]
MNVDESTLITFVGQYFWPLSRITAFFLAAPIFGTRVVSAKVRIVLGFSLTAIVAPLIPPLPLVPDISLETMIITLQQVLIGLALAFVFQIVFQVFILAGQYIAMKMGLGFALMNDPANGVSVTVISQFYLLTTSLLFLSVNGHLMVIEILVESFAILPIALNGMSTNAFYQIVALGSWMFASALSIALPVLTALLIVNIAFGVMSRAAPQINIFAVGFPVTLIFGLLLIWIGFLEFLPLFQQLIDQSVYFAQAIFR